jgi:hypothetical protein
MATQSLTDPAPPEDAATRAQLDAWRSTSVELRSPWVTPDQGTPPRPINRDDIVLVISVPAETFDRLERDAADQDLDVHRWARLLLRAASVATSSTDR